MSLTDVFDQFTMDNEAAEPVVAPRLPLVDGVPGAAAPAVRALLDEQMLDQMVAQVRADGGRLTGPGSFLSELCKAVLERGLQAELGAHLSYDKHDPAGKGSGNSRNGSTPKTVQTEIGPVALDVPRDRAGTFTPMLVPKGERRLGGLSDVIISLYAGGMTVRDICHHLQRVYGTEISPDDRRAAAASRRADISTSMTWPCWSMARYTYRHTPATFPYVSSTNQRSPGERRANRAASASSGVNRCTHR